MNYIDKLRPLENGSAGSVRAQSAAIIALAPMMLEGYLSEPVTAAQVESAVKAQVTKHATECKADVAKMPLGKGGVALGLIKAGGVPGAVVWGLVQFSAEIKVLLESWAK